MIRAKANGKTASCKVTVKKVTATKAKTGIYQKLYTPTVGYQVTFKPGNALIVTDISGGKIQFVVEHFGINGSPLYQTNTITANLNGNKVSRFNWKDGWGNTGTGSLTFASGKVTVTMKYLTESSYNRSGWFDSETMPFKTAKLSAKEKEYYSTLN